MVGHADRRVAPRAEPECHVRIGLGRAGHGVGGPIGLGLLGQVDAFPLLALDVLAEGVFVELVPGDLALAHPEWGDLGREGRPLVGLPLLLADGLPMVKVPPGIGTMSNFSSEPGITSV